MPPALDFAVGCAAATLARVQGGNDARALMPGEPPASEEYGDAALLDSCTAFLEAMTAPGSAEICGVRVGNADEGVPVLLPALQRHDGVGVFAPRAFTNGKSFDYRLAAQFAIGDALPCRPLDSATTRKPGAAEAAVIAAGRLPVQLVEESFDVNLTGAREGLLALPADTGRAVLQDLPKVVVLVGRDAVSKGLPRGLKKAACTVVRTLMHLQMVAAVVVLCTLAGKAREASGLPVRSAEAAALAVAPLLSRAPAVSAEWVVALLPGGVALPMPALLRDALLRTLDALITAGTQPAEATVGITRLGVRVSGLSGSA
jgi:hypothetical protein